MRKRRAAQRKGVLGAQGLPQRPERHRRRYSFCRIAAASFRRRRSRACARFVGGGDESRAAGCNVEPIREQSCSQLSVAALCCNRAPVVDQRRIPSGQNFCIRYSCGLRRAFRIKKLLSIDVSLAAPDQRDAILLKRQVHGQSGRKLVIAPEAKAKGFVQTIDTIQLETGERAKTTVRGRAVVPTFDASRGSDDFAIVIVCSLEPPYLGPDGTQRADRRRTHGHYEENIDVARSHRCALAGGPERRHGHHKASASWQIDTRR